MSDYLFAQPSFISGVARAIDLLGVFDEYNDSATDREADALAFRLDWLAVRNDVAAAQKIDPNIYALSS